MNASISPIFISASSASRPNVLEWCNITSTIIFAAKHDICVAAFDEDISHYRILNTIHAHSADITCIKLAKLKKPQFEDKSKSFFCTASNDGEVAAWSLTNVKGERSICCLFKNKGETTIELAKMFILDANCKFILATAQFNLLESFIAEFEPDKYKLIEKQTLNFPRCLILHFDFVYIHNLLILAIGLSSGVINFFHTEENVYEFRPNISLTVMQNSWIRVLTFKENNDNVLLANSSDNIVRIWELSLHENGIINDQEQESILTPHKFDIGLDHDGKRYTILLTLQSILTDHEHEGFVHSLVWHPNRNELLSTSTHKSVIRWCYNDEQSIWLPISRLGEVGGDIVSYYDASYSPTGQSILYHSLSGGFFCWDIEENLKPKPFPISGHQSAVTDIAWDPNGFYLLSCGLDKTTRIFASSRNGRFFYEFARPQIHGHPLNCIASISSYLFVSGGEEKIFRVFETTLPFVRRISEISADKHFESISEKLSSNAFQSELSITNKAQFTDSTEVQFDLQDPPREDQLNKLTLFPEAKKLYGHSYEVYSIACNNGGTLLATACKASHPEHATILLWDIQNWQQINVLRAHKLTVTKMAFSRDDNFLLSVSRDRTWALFCRAPSEQFAYSLYYHANNASTSHHTRIIWDCSWSHDSEFFATVSRDNALNLWRVNDCNCTGDDDSEKVKLIGNYISITGISAVDFAHSGVNSNDYLVAIGMDDGCIALILISNKQNFSVLSQLSKDIAHSDAITRLCFRPFSQQRESTEECFQLASASANNIVKIYMIQLFFSNSLVTTR